MLQSNYFFYFAKTYRCYRYGQDKEVFVYRFLTVGSVEEKLYKRIVTKHQLAQEVIDGKNILRMFTRDEIENLNAEVDNWAECDTCGKWRMFPPGFDTKQLPDKVSFSALWAGKRITHDSRLI